MLIQAASGLERMMYANQKGVLKDSTVAQISAFVYYEAAVISKLTTNKAFQNAFSKIMFDQINLDFGNYIDALARSKPKSLHHVYEWKKTGNKSARLFKLNKIDSGELSFKVGYEFKPSKEYWSSYNLSISKSAVEREVNKFSLGSCSKAMWELGWTPNKGIEYLMTETMKQNYELITR